jgi:hypothetical protein
MPPRTDNASITETMVFMVFSPFNYSEPDTAKAVRHCHEGCADGRPSTVP